MDAIMNFMNGLMPIKGIGFFMVCVFAIILIGFAIGRITIKGISLGDAGVFIVALAFGCLFYSQLDAQLVIKTGEQVVSYTSNALKIVENLGLFLFVTSVGFIAGPKFFSNMKKNFKSYVPLGLIVILAGALSAVGCIYLGKLIGLEGGTKALTAMIVGLLSGSLTSTPAFSAANDTIVNMFGESAPALATEYEELIAAGHGIAYIFGVLGVVLFVQLIPKMMKADMNKERALLTVADTGSSSKKNVGKLFDLDGHGFAVFALAVIIGIVVGSIQIPLTGEGFKGTCFSLGNTGGCLVAALILGHFGRIGKINLMPKESTLKLFREFGLILFLVAAGIKGGPGFIESFNPIYFLFGIIMTIIPMIIGFFFAKYVLKLSLLNNLGSLTGGMTSTPALGALIQSSGTDDVASAYAATYPIALIAVVLVSMFLLRIF